MKTKRAGSEKRPGVRRSPPVDHEAIRKVHRLLAGVQCVLPRDPSLPVLLRLYRSIRFKRNRAARVLAGLAPRMGQLKSELVRLERLIERETAFTLESGDGLAGATNAALRTARLRIKHSREYDARASVEQDLAVLSEAVSHARLVLSELQAAFEEASRSQAAVELEAKLEVSRA